MISLRAYNRQIEQQIDAGEYDQAIIHCRYILSKYPKYIEAYRNLGKCLLEQKKYSEATDIFLRILGVYPDDFISHVGLSIIYEEKKDIDTAIWHMEQSFDVQPANLAIQDELKRLIQIRDGEQPQKIRLTRGALVRMYSRGELFQQAISEIQSVLTDDPKRIDLEVILAQMHYLAGESSEAKALAQSIVDRLPYCFDANLILYQINLSENNSEGVSISRKKLITIDPYFEFSQPPYSTLDVAEEKILLDLYTPDLGQESVIHTTIWSDSDELIDTTPKEEIDWLKGITSNHLKDKTSLSETPELQIDDQQLKLTDLEMQNSPDEQEKRMVFEPISEKVFTQQSDNNNSASPKSIDSDKTSIYTGDEPSDRNDTNASSTTDLSMLFSEFKEGKMDDVNNGAIENQNNQELPSTWLPQDQSEIKSDSHSETDLPDWLKNIENQESDNSSLSDELPDWLRDLQTTIEPQAKTISDNPVSSATQDMLSQVDSDQMEEISRLEQLSDQSSQQPVQLDNGWEKIDLTSQDNDSPTLSEQKPAEISEDVVPDWVKNVLMTQEPHDDEHKSQSAETGPLSLSRMEEPIEDTIPTNEESGPDSGDLYASFVQKEDGAISQQTNDELLDWLRNLKDESKAPVSESPVENNEESSLDVEEINFNDPTPIEEQIQEEQQLNNLPIVEESIMQESSIEFSKEKEIDQIGEEVSPLNQEEPVDITIESALEQQNFDELSAFLHRIKSDGGNIDDAMQIVFDSHIGDNGTYEYWREIGDLLAKHNYFSKALEAYEKAEALIVRSLKF